MKRYILFLPLFCVGICYPNDFFTEQPTLEIILNQIDRKLTDEEVQKRGLDVLAAEVIEKIDEIDLRKTARSAIFETSYGFRWKMINLHTGNIIIIKVNKEFKLISARNSKKIK
ncbi:hypothetical protein D1818_06920 [Aquimarina sp. BL5]|uniref:hypothetical protein n=1 Tax=Aquimarina sp. BL5 TaxID=1714860 RepID=UPI000E4FB8B4|nr:hypothetical protein [Aquimarina sp. BL5]AXT50575.1 hypothetical protein D1818_06920 [Aquimarina sp. BL5]RKN02918.1 hypothetical protein D7036_15390 [Aquimarina sp. BL5]